MCFTLIPSFCSASTNISHCVDLPARSRPSNTISFPRAIFQPNASNTICEQVVLICCCVVEELRCRSRKFYISKRGRIGVRFGAKLRACPPHVFPPLLLYTFANTGDSHTKRNSAPRFGAPPQDWDDPQGYPIVETTSRQSHLASGSRAML